MTFSNKNLIMIFLAVPAVIIAGICLWRFFGNETDRGDIFLSDNLASADLVFKVDYNWNFFNEAIKNYPYNEEVVEPGVVGLVVPHHDLAAAYSAEAFQKICSYDIERVIIVGPNHGDFGAAAVITGNIVYDLPAGRVYSETELIKDLVSRGLAVEDVPLLSSEHSIYTVVPYVHYCFPDAKIIPLILSSRLPLEEAVNLGRYLSSYINDKTIIVGSIDFSHYLSSEEAGSRDQETKDAILRRDYELIYSFNDEHIDSPASAVLVLNAAGEYGAGKIDIIRIANQAEAMGAKSLTSSTSYFTILLRK